MFNLEYIILTQTLNNCWILPFLQIENGAETMAADLIETLFSAMDVNGDGSISKDEMNAVFKSFDADGITLLQFSK